MVTVASRSTRGADPGASRRQERGLSLAGFRDVPGTFKIGEGSTRCRSTCTGIDEVNAKPLVCGDGLALTRDGKLVAVTDKLGANGVEEVTVLRSSDGYRSASVVSSQAWPIAGPTTVALTPYGGYVLSGRIGVVLAGGTSDELDLRRI